MRPKIYRGPDAAEKFPEYLQNEERIIRRDIAISQSVCPSVIISFSGAEFENHSVYLIETWQSYQAHAEVVPFDILGFF